MNNNINIEDIEFRIESNVKQYWISLYDSQWNLKYYDDKIFESDSEPTYIFLLENVYQSQFSHWVFESAVFLPYYQKLKKILNKNIKIFTISNPKRKYKELFFNYFDIKKNDLIECDKELTSIHRLSRNNKWMNDCSYSLPENNICIICPIININNQNMDVKCFKNYIYNFKNLILIHEKIQNKKIIENLFFPRGKQENFKVNDRIINYGPVFNILKNKNYIEYYTDNTKDIIDQINLLRTSKNIFLDYGSSLWVNGLFCNNSTIYVSKNLNQHQDWVGFSLLLEIIKEYNNNIIFIS